MATYRQLVLVLLDPWITSRNPTWNIARQTPTHDIEQTPPLFTFRQCITTLDSRTPPLTEMSSRTELHEVVLVFGCPTRKSVIVAVRRNPPSPRANQELPIVRYANTTVRTIDFLRHDRFP